MAKGVNCARKLLKIRKKYLKIRKAPFYTTNHIQNAMVLEFRPIGAKQPNSGLRKCIKVQYLKSKKKKLVFVPGCGAIDLIKVHDIVTIQSLAGRKGGAKGDLSGTNMKVIKVNDVSLKQKLLGRK